MREPNHYTFFTENVNDFFAFVENFLIFWPQQGKNTAFSARYLWKSVRTCAMIEKIRLYFLILQRRNTIMQGKWQQKVTQFKILLRSIPATVVTLFVVSVICMNLLANKTLLQLDWIALDGGILISWLSFMCMDIITKHFGPRASNGISFLAVAINLLTCFIFFIASIIPSNAGDYSAFNGIFGGTWFILLGSTIAFIFSALVNNTLNWLIGKWFRNAPNGKLAFLTRAYVSTFIGQFLDNLLFSIIVFMCFAPRYWDRFHWTLPQCIMCALTGAVAELIMEVAFSPMGYRITQRWQREAVGREYFDYIKKENKP